MAVEVLAVEVLAVEVLAVEVLAVVDNRLVEVLAAVDLVVDLVVEVLAVVDNRLVEGDCCPEADLGSSYSPRHPFQIQLNRIRHVGLYFPVDDTVERLQV